MRKSYIVDGMLSGTGIRDAVEGGYVQLRISPALSNKLAAWLLKYEEAHFHQLATMSRMPIWIEKGCKSRKRYRLSYQTRASNISQTQSS